MIDHLMAFKDEVAAHADPVVGKYWTPGVRGVPPAWDNSCTPGIEVWDPATDTLDPNDGGVVYNLIDTQFRVMITTPEPVDDLVNHPNCELVVDHGSAALLKTTFTPEQLHTLYLQPVLSGATYPFLSGQGGLAK